MRIISYGCEHYKPFKEKVSLELRPLTLIFGKNSSGKSALVHLIRLLLRSLSSANRADLPLKVDELSFGSQFVDLIHAKLPHGSASFSIKLETEQESLDLTSTLQNIHDPSAYMSMSSDYTVVSKFKLRSPKTFTLDWIQATDSAPFASYEGLGMVKFQGLLPDARNLPEGQEWQFLEEWRTRIQSVDAYLEHLGPYRTTIPRVFETGRQGELGFKGEGAPYRLALHDELLERTGAWYYEHLDGWRLSISPSGRAFECLLTRGRASVNLADAGQGMQQVLPIVVQQLTNQVIPGRPFLNLIEQPELHLHTAAQAPLGDLFLASAQTGRGQIIVETHSENLLLRIRRRIAEGLYPPDLVQIYWVEDHPDGRSIVKPITIDENGELDWWQDGVFSEGYEEVRAIARASRSRRQAGGSQV